MSGKRCWVPDQIDPLSLLGCWVERAPVHLDSGGERVTGWIEVLNSW